MVIHVRLLFVVVLILVNLRLDIVTTFQGHEWINCRKIRFVNHYFDCLYCLNTDIFTDIPASHAHTLLEI